MHSKLFFSLLLLLLGCVQFSSGLRCYTCEDCDERSQLKELEVCSVPQQTDGTATGLPSTPSSSPSPNPAVPAANVPSPSPAPAPAPAAAASAPASVAVQNSKPPAAPAAGKPPAPAAAPAPASSSGEEDYDSDEDESGPQPTLGIMAAGSNVIGTGAATATGVAAATGAGAAAAETEEEDEDEDYDDRRRRRSSRQALITPTAVCYIASLKLNGTEITNRGCTIVTGQSDNQTAVCRSLFNGWDVVGCQLCEENGCNAPIHATVVGQLSNGSSRIRLALGGILLAIFNGYTTAALV